MRRLLRRCSRLGWLGGALLFLATSLAAQNDGSPSRAPLPELDLSRLENAVAEQLANARRELERILAEPEAGPQDKALAFGELAELYHAYDLREPARIAYENARALDPDQIRWLYGAGRLAQGRGDLERAELLFREVVERQPKHFLAWFRLGETLLAGGRPAAAEEAFQRAHSLRPNDPAVLAALGDLALSRDEPRKAVELFETVLEQVPAANRLHYSLGLAHRALGDLEAARRHLARRGEVGVTVDDPLESRMQEVRAGERVHLLRGRQAFQVGRWEEAVQAFLEALEAAPSSVRARINLASALTQAGRVDEAKEMLAQALELEPDNPTAHFNLGILEMRAGKVDEAIRHLRRSVEIQPEDVAARLELARLLEGAGRTEEALGHYARIAEKHPETQPEARYRRAVLLVELGRYEEALERLEASHADLPQHGPIAGALARLLAASPVVELRDGPTALDLARRAFEAAPTVFHGETVAMALAETGRCAQAAQWQRRLLEEIEHQGGEPSEAQRTALARYQSGPPCRPPGGADFS